MLNQFGEFMPNLIELKLGDSLIQCINDIGTSFKNLKILNITNCNLKDLSGNKKIKIYRHNLFSKFGNTRSTFK